MRTSLLKGALCWLGLWTLSLAVALPVLCLVLFVIGWEYGKRARVGERCRHLRLRIKLVFLRRQERREEQAAAALNKATPSTSYLRAGWTDQVRCAPPEERTIFRDVVLF